MGSASRKRWAPGSFQFEIRVLSFFFLLLSLCLSPSDLLHTGRVSASELTSQPLQEDPHDAVQCYRCHSLETKEQAFDREGIVIPFPQRDVHMFQNQASAPHVQGPAIDTPDVPAGNEPLASEDDDQ